MTGPSYEPLDGQERELARILRALPGAEPSAAMDQRILRAAADAAATSRRPARRWIGLGGASWGIGGAAAAVLALGVGWHLLDPTRGGPVERTAPAAAPAAEDAALVTLGESRAQVADAAAIAPPPPPPNAPSLPPRGASARTSRGPMPAAAPPAAIGPVASDPAPVPSPLAPAPFAQERPLANRRASDPAVAAQELSAIAEADALARTRAQGAAQADMAGAAAAKAEAATAAPQRNEVMRPAAWLAEVRRLRDSDRRAEAAESLRRFQRHYRQYAIPTDLLPLLRE